MRLHEVVHDREPQPGFPLPLRLSGKGGNATFRDIQEDSGSHIHYGKGKADVFENGSDSHLAIAAFHGLNMLCSASLSIPR